MSPPKSSAKASATSAEASGHLKVTQVRSAIATKPKHRRTLWALGLRGVGRSRILPDRPDVRGMLARVPHLVLVTSAGADEVTNQNERSAATRAARRAGRSGSAAATSRRTKAGVEGTSS